MNAVFVDTSAVLALFNADDDNHARAAAVFEKLKSRQARLVSTSFVLVETYALVGRRLGLDAVKSLRSEFMPIVDIVWVDARLHEAGLDLLLARGKRQLSLVDAVSFAVMREAKLEEAFAYDPHFQQEGFTELA
jgi:predicted nucleic acid-binding protein